MTPAQQRVLLAIAAHWKANGFCPSYKEIAAAAELTSLSTVQKHIQALIAKGYLNQDEHYSGNARARTLTITPKFYKTTSTCPLCGGPIAPSAVSG